MITPTENNMTPQETVDALDRYIIGQTEAKKAVAIALRNRWRRLQLGEDLKDEILPKNIIMIGATGIGKTEIARRISRLVNAPFIKVEASKFTEVGYVGRDVESMIRDLTDNSINMVRQEQMERKQDEAREMVEERLLNMLLPPAGVKQDDSEEIVAPIMIIFFGKISSFKSSPNCRRLQRLRSAIATAFFASV